MSKKSVQGGNAVPEEPDEARVPRPVP